MLLHKNVKLSGYIWDDIFILEHICCLMWCPVTVFLKRWPFVSHVRSTCCLFLTQCFRKRQNDIFACDNYPTFREYGLMCPVRSMYMYSRVDVCLTAQNRKKTEENIRKMTFLCFAQEGIHALRTVKSSACMPFCAEQRNFIFLCLGTLLRFEKLIIWEK